MGSQYESEEVAKFGEQDWFKGLQIIQFQCTESHLCGPYWKMEELIISLDLHSLSKENTCAYMLLWMGFLTQSDSNLTRVILESDSSQNFDSSELIKKPNYDMIYET